MEIYTDGSTLRNGAKDAVGGFGVVVVNDNGDIIAAHSKKSMNTTNNREEMKAIIWAYKNFGSETKDIPAVYSDSAYAVNTFNIWMWGWKNNGWRKSNKQIPENLDLIKIYDIIYMSGKRINLKHIKGHNGINGNELADKLATGKMSVTDILPEK